MVSERNRHRKTAEKIDKPAEKLAESLNVKQIINAVVEVLKPDLQQKIEGIETSLSNQIKTEMQDLRSRMHGKPYKYVQMI